MNRQFREIQLPNLLLEVLRSNYAANANFTINNLYRFLLCLLYPLQSLLGDFFSTTRQTLALKASCNSIVGQIENILNMIYMNLTAEELTEMRNASPMQRPPIQCQNSADETGYLYPQSLSGSPEVYLYPEDMSTGSPFYLYSGPTSIRVFDVSVPASFAASDDYSDFVATLNSFMILSINYNITQREGE